MSNGGKARLHLLQNFLKYAFLKSRFSPLGFKEGQSTGTFNSLVFYNNSTVEFGFTGISDTVSNVSMVISVTVWAGEWVLFFTLIHSFLVNY